MTASYPPAAPPTLDALPPSRPGWKTYLGALLVILGALCQPDVLAILPANVAHVVQAIGAALGLVGLRTATATVERKTDYLLGNRPIVPPAGGNPLQGTRR